MGRGTWSRNTKTLKAPCKVVCGPGPEKGSVPEDDTTRQAGGIHRQMEKMYMDAYDFWGPCKR